VGEEGTFKILQCTLLLVYVVNRTLQPQQHNNNCLTNFFGRDGRQSKVGKPAKLGRTAIFDIDTDGLQPSIEPLESRYSVGSGIRKTLVTCSNFRFGVERHPITAGVSPTKFCRTAILDIDTHGLPSSEPLESRCSADGSGFWISLVTCSNLRFGVKIACNLWG